MPLDDVGEVVPDDRLHVAVHRLRSGLLVDGRLGSGRRQVAGELAQECAEVGHGFVGRVIDGGGHTTGSGGASGVRVQSVRPVGSQRAIEARIAAA